MTILGFDKPLYILPFDHRGSFQKKMFGWDGALSAQQTAEIAAAKRVIYDAYITATDTTGEITRNAAVAEIARRYQEFVEIFEKPRESCSCVTIEAGTGTNTVKRH